MSDPVQDWRTEGRIVLTRGQKIGIAALGLLLVGAAATVTLVANPDNDPAGLGCINSLRFRGQNEAPDPHAPQLYIPRQPTIGAKHNKSDRPTTPPPAPSVAQTARPC